MTPLFSAIKERGKALLRDRLRAQGFEVVRREATNGRSLSLFKLLVERVIAKSGNGTIVQIGAHDGFFDDPVHEVVVSLGSQAILVEPLPDVFKRLRENYAGVQGLQFENVAIGAQTGRGDIFRVNPNVAGLPQWLHSVASFDKTLLLRQQKRVRGIDIRPHIEAVPVPIVTMGELLERHPKQRPIIALQVDAEGYDFVVVKSAAEAGCLPPVVAYEHKHMTYSDQIACRDFLSGHGYALCSAGQDTFGFREPTQ